MKALVEMNNMLKHENTKLKNHIEMQDLTIQKLYAQLNNPPTTISSSGYFQANIPKYTLTYCNTADEENTKLKQVISKAIELTNEIIKQGWDYYEKDMTAYKLLDILDILGENNND